MSKLDINPDFDYGDSPSLTKEINELTVMAIVFSLPVLGQLLLILWLAYDLMVSLIRRARLLSIISKHYLWKQIKSLI